MGRLRNGRRVGSHPSFVPPNSLAAQDPTQRVPACWVLFTKSLDPATAKAACLVQPTTRPRPASRPLIRSDQLRGPGQLHLVLQSYASLPPPTILTCHTRPVELPFKGHSSRGCCSARFDARLPPACCCEP